MVRSQEFRALWQAMQSPRIVVIYTVAALAIASNWLIFVWAVSINQIVQISLGYFINPLLSVVFGMVSSMSGFGGCSGCRWRSLPRVWCI